MTKTERVPMRRIGTIVGAILVTAAAGSGAYAVAGWLGVGVLGLLVTFIAFQVEFDDAAPIGGQQNTGLYAASLRGQDQMGRAEKAARRAEAATTLKVLGVVKLCSILLAVVGGCGFFSCTSALSTDGSQSNGSAESDAGASSRGVTLAR